MSRRKKLCVRSISCASYVVANDRPLEQESDRQIATLLADDVFDSAYRNRKINLTSLTRYDMVKSRLW